MKINGKFVYCCTGCPHIEECAECWRVEADQETQKRIEAKVKAGRK